MLEPWSAPPLNDGASTSTAHLARKPAAKRRGKKADTDVEDEVPVESDAIPEESSSESLATPDDDDESEDDEDDDDIEESEEEEEPAKPAAKPPARGKPAARGKAAAKAAPAPKRAPAKSKATLNTSVVAEKTSVVSKKLNPVSISSPSGMPQRRVGLSKRVKTRPLSPVRIPSANASK